MKFLIVIQKLMCQIWWIFKEKSLYFSPKGGVQKQNCFNFYLILKANYNTLSSNKECQNWWLALLGCDYNADKNSKYYTNRTFITANNLEINSFTFYLILDSPI